MLNAASTEEDIAKSDATASGGKVGVGASVALNILTDSGSRAEIEDGVTVAMSGGHVGAVSLTASETRTVETTVKAGSKGDVSVTPAVALALVKNDAATARLGSGGGDTLVGLGTVTIQATHGMTVTNTKADAAAAGGTAAVGAGVALNVIVDWTTTAETARSVTGTSATIVAQSTMNSAAESSASASGGDKNGGDADSTANKQVNGSNPNTNSTGAGAVPKAGDNANSANSQSGGQSGSQGSGVGIAAAITVNDVNVSNTARIVGGADVTATGGGPVVVGARSSVDGKAQADSTAVNLGGDVEIGAAVSLNFVNLSNIATVSNGSVVTGNGITVEAVTTNNDRNDFVATAYTAAGNKSGSASVAGAIALNVVDAETRAVTADGSDLESSGPVSVTAEHTMGLQAIAASGAFSGENGFGAAVAINIIGTGSGGSNTIASLGDPDTAGSGAVVHADGAVSVSATHTIAMLGTIDLPTSINAKVADPSISIGSLAVAGAAGGGSVGVAGSAGINIFVTTTRASVDRGATVAGKTGANAGSLSVSATDTLDWTSVAGSIGIGLDGVGVGAGLDLGIVTKDTRAYIGQGANVTTAGDVALTSMSSENVLSIAANAGIGGSSGGIAGSASVWVVTTGSRAYVEDAPNASARAKIVAGGNVPINATGNFTGKLIAASLGAGSSVGVGAGNETLIHTDTVEAYLGDYAEVTSNGGEGARIVANSDEQLIGITAAGSGSGSVSVSGAATVNVLGETTTSRVGRGAKITATPASGTPDLWVKANDTTTMVTVAGSLALSGSVGVGVGVDVTTLNKTTKAYIDSGVVATITGDIDVSANSTEDITSVAAGLSASGTAAVTADASVHVITNTTRAFIGDEDGVDSLGPGDVHATGSVGVAANDSTEIDKVVGAASFSGTAAITAGAGVTVSNKTTEAFVGVGAKVTGDGQSALDAPTGTFDLNASASPPAQQYDNSPGADNSNAAGIEASGASNQSASQLAAKGEVSPPTPIGSGEPGSAPKDENGNPVSVSNDDLNRNVHLSPNRALARGVIVAATNNDDIESYAIGLSGSGTVAIAIATSVNVANATTHAYIADGANVNGDTSAANGAQQVIVVAANDFRHTAAAVGLAASAGVAVSPAVDVTVTDNKTTAEIGAATVHAKDDVRSQAQASERLLLVGVGLAGATVGVGAGLNVSSLNATTKASAGGMIRAGGDLVVRSDDETDVTVISGGLGVGFVGVGAGVGVLTIDKDTQAYIANGADVTALGAGTGETVRDGNLSGSTFNTTTAHGVIVDARSGENVFNLAIAGGGGFVGASGSVAVTVVNSSTQGLIGDADVNKNDNGLASPDQDVFVDASNQVTAQTIVVAVAGGFVGVGGSVDVGVLDNNTTPASRTGRMSMRRTMSRSTRSRPRTSRVSSSPEPAGSSAWPARWPYGRSARRWTAPSRTTRAPRATRLRRTRRTATVTPTTRWTSATTHSRRRPPAAT